MAKKNAELEIEVFKKSLEGKTLSELQEIEKTIVKEAEKVDKEIASTEFDLPVNNRKEVFEALQSFIEKQNVQWQFSLGMLKMYEAWSDSSVDKIAYPVLDSTLRTLGQMQFQGHDDWKKVVMINEYFKDIRDKYVATSEKVFTVADKHQALLTAMDKLEGQEKLNTPITSK